MRGTVTVPGDKSISHRAAIIAALAGGVSRIEGYSPGEDCAATLSVLEALGVEIEREGSSLRIAGRGRSGFRAREGVVLDCGNSGTTMRLISGVLAASQLEVVLDGDESLRRRPMRRIADPLGLMGAVIESDDPDCRAPLRIRGGGLEGIRYETPVASAQVKSAILLAGLKASGTTTVCEHAPTRDHTERMLAALGIRINKEGNCVSVLPGTPEPLDERVPGDFSSAAFFLAAALLVPGSKVEIEGVGLNPTRTGFLRVLEKMGASIEASGGAGQGEPAGTILAEHGELHGVEIGPVEVAEAIDEVTLLALLATSAEGRTVISGAGELRNKESDRLRAAARGLRAMGAVVEETPDGMLIEGPVFLNGATVDSARDHRIAMMFAVAGLAAGGETVVSGWEWTRISYPGFTRALRSLSER